MRMMPWVVRVMVGTEHRHLHLFLTKSAKGLDGVLSKGEGSRNSAEDLLPSEQSSLGLVFQEWSDKSQKFNVGHSKSGSLSVCLWL